MKTALIIGGGFAGCAAAHQLALKGGWNTTLVEAGPALGAGVRTAWYGGHPHTFGPRHFLTQKPQIYEFLNSYLPLRLCQDHIFWTYIEEEQQFFNYPIHMDDIPRMKDSEKIRQELNNLNNIKSAVNFEQYWIASVGKTLYDKFINTYSKKMWQVKDNAEIDTFSWSPKGVALKEGSREAWDTAISAYPADINGYDAYFDIATADANVLLNTRIEQYNIPDKKVVINNEEQRFDIIINTISPDTLFNHCHGELPFVGRDITRIVLPVKQALPDNVYFVYYASDEPYTRVVEYKKFTGYQSDSTLITLEKPSSNGKYYPMPIQAEYAKAQKYFDEMPDGVFSIGRAGSYLYWVDIDDCIDQAITLAKDL